MEILHWFDGGVARPYTLDGGRLTFDLKQSHVLDVVVTEAPPDLEVRLLVSKDTAGYLLNQGALASMEGSEFVAVPLAEAEPGVLVARLGAAPVAREVRIATRHPYGRDALDRLLCETRGMAHLAVRLLHRDQRMMPLFEFGEEDGRRPIHYFVAGEDVCETAGCWVADEMVRLLADSGSPAAPLLEDALIRVVPLVSPYSAAYADTGSYLAPDGRGIYGAATWGDPLPPPEYALLREEVMRTAEARRLGLFLTLHSWHAQYAHSGLETIRTAGDNELTGARLEWARRTLEVLIAEVPHGRAELPERIWHAGLARDYLLRAHGLVTFRIEVTTSGQGREGFRQTARGLLAGAARVSDWRPVWAT